jgi:Leucine rich repeat
MKRPLMAATPEDGPKAGQAATRQPIRFGLSVRTLMLFVLVLGCRLGYHMRADQVQREAVAAIQEVGGSVDYAWRWGKPDPDLVGPAVLRRAAKWLAKRIGVDHVADVVYVNLMPRGATSPKKADDGILREVGRLRRLEHLVLCRTALTDVGLTHLKGLTNLRELDIRDTRISGAGLAQLEGLTNLRQIFLGGDRITEDAVLRLEKANPGISILREEDWPDARRCRRADVDLNFARSQPIRLASALLVHRAGSMVHRNEPAEFIATVDALCALEVNDTWSPIKKAEALAQCLGLLQSTLAFRLTEPQWQSLHRCCTESGIASLTGAFGRRSGRRPELP